MHSTSFVVSNLINICKLFIVLSSRWSHYVTTLQTKNFEGISLTQLGRDHMAIIWLTIVHHWLRQWPGAEQVRSHYLNQWWPSLLTRICHVSSSYYHNQNGSINLSLCCHIFPRLCVWGGCTTIYIYYIYMYIYIYIYIYHIYVSRGIWVCVFNYCAVFWCAQIIVYFKASWSYTHVCTLHYLICRPIRRHWTG